MPNYSLADKIRRKNCESIVLRLKEIPYTKPPTERALYQAAERIRWLFSNGDSKIATDMGAFQELFSMRFEYMPKTSPYAVYLYIGKILAEDPITRQEAEHAGRHRGFETRENTDMRPLADLLKPYQTGGSDGSAE